MTLTVELVGNNKSGNQEHLSMLKKFLKNRKVQGLFTLRPKTRSRGSIKNRVEGVDILSHNDRGVEVHIDNGNSKHYVEASLNAKGMRPQQLYKMLLASATSSKAVEPSELTAEASLGKPTPASASSKLDNHQSHIPTGDAVTTKSAMTGYSKDESMVDLILVAIQSITTRTNAAVAVKGASKLVVEELGGGELNARAFVPVLCKLQRDGLLAELAEGRLKYYALTQKALDRISTQGVTQKSNADVARESKEATTNETDKLVSRVLDLRKKFELYCANQVVMQELEVVYEEHMPKIWEIEKKIRNLQDQLELETNLLGLAQQELQSKQSSFPVNLGTFTIEEVVEGYRDYKKIKDIL